MPRKKRDSQFEVVRRDVVGPLQSQARKQTETGRVIAQALYREVSTITLRVVMALRQVWNSYRRLQTRRDESGVKVSSSVSLGEKRFVSVVEVSGARYLIGGGRDSVALLAHLQEQPSQKTFSAVMDRLTTQDATVQ